MRQKFQGFFFLTFLSMMVVGWTEDSWPYVNKGPSEEQRSSPENEKMKRSPQEREAFREKLKKMTPEERQKFLSQKPFYQRMTPEQQERFCKRMLEDTPENGRLKSGEFNTQNETKKKGEPPHLTEEQNSLETKAHAAQDEQARMEMRKRFEQMSPEDRQKVMEFRKRLSQMTPEERRKAAQESPLFQNLSPEQKEAFKRSMEGRRASGESFRREPPSPEMLAMREEMKKKWEGLSEEQRKAVMDFRSQFRNMTPEQRRERAAQLPFFKDLSADQKELLQNHFRAWDQLPSDERNKTLDNYEKWKKLSPEEREKYRQKLIRKREEGSLQEKAGARSDVH